VAEQRTTIRPDAGVDDTALLEEETLRFAQELLRISTENTGDRARGGRVTEVAEPVPGRGSVVARLRGAQPEAGVMVLHAHLDVVPTEPDDWTFPPFAASIHDGQLWDRGALDLKSYAAVLLATARHLARTGIVPRRDLVFAFFADEEGGGVDGAAWLVRHRPKWFAAATGRSWSRRSSARTRPPR